MGYGTVVMNLHQEPKGEGTLGGFQYYWGGVKFFKNTGLSGISDQNTPSSALLKS